MEDRVTGQRDAPYLSEVVAAISRGATVVTPGSRAANRLARQVDATAAREGQQSWRAARILPWTAWVNSHWDSALLHSAETRVLLNRVQEVALWESIILEDGHATEQSALLQAESCVRASGLLGRYGAGQSFSSHAFAGSLSHDAATFYRWYCRFQELCIREDYLPAAAVEAELGVLVRQRRIPVESEVVLLGFPEFAPSRRQLLDALREAGSAVHEQNVSSALKPLPQYLHYADRETELRACARWVRECLDRTPQETVRVVVPDLPDARNEIERELRLAVSPGSVNVVNAAAVAYEFSTGMPLQSVPLVRDALLLLRWCTEGLPLEGAGALIRSSHLALAASAEDGALLETEKLLTRAPLRKEVTLRQASALLYPHAASGVLADLHRQSAGLHSATAAFARFTTEAQSLLQTGGWPGREPLNPDETQAVEAWQRALDALSSLDLLGKKTSWSAFLQKLQTQLSSAELTPAYTDLPVQVTGVEEAMGSPVDALWFLHAEANTWPPQTALNPLLPLALQHEFGMPGVDSQRDEEAATARLEQMLHSTAGELRLSFGGSQEQDAGRPSPIAERVLSAIGVQVTTVADISEAEHAGPRLETFLDLTPLPALPESGVSGGVSILTAQAQCGFRAWAEKRLFLTPLEEADAGLSPRERGDQVHAVLQAFWTATGTQQALRSKRMAIGADGISERDRLLQACIADVCATKSAEAWDEAYLSVQKRRLFRLLAAWLDYEEQRPPFEVVQLEQETKDVPVGPLKLHMRVDRIDRVLAAAEDGSEELGTLLIDYKTGSRGNSPREWSGERPEQPQLPAYATAAMVSAELGALNGIAFAAVRTGTDKMQLHGLAEPGLLPSRQRRSETTFLSEKEEWRRHLEALAQAFADGIADVAPKTFPRTCDTCGQRLLCRLDAATLLEADGDASDPSDPEAE